MCERRLATVVLLSVLVVLAGCTAAPTGGQAAQQSTGAPATGAAPRATPGASNPASGNVAPDYTGLYRDTIGSVVMLQVRTAQGTVEGSGFVYDGQGHVVTNQHVVGSANTVEVLFRDGEWRTGTVVGTDPYSDLAVVKVANPPDYATPLPVARSNPRPGEHVVALGSPFGLEGSITAGIVSGVNRSMPTQNGFSIPDTVQTDAAINPGNSGGPLVSLDGEVVGVNRATGGDNVGFAISAAIIRRVVPSLIDHGSYDHAYMGVVTVDVTPTIARANDLGRAQGVLVVQTTPSGPSAGVLHPSPSGTPTGGQSVPTGGDVIVAIDGHPIGSHQDLSRYLSLSTSPGQTIDVTVLRDGSRQTVQVKLGRRPAP